LDTLPGLREGNVAAEFNLNDLLFFVPFGARAGVGGMSSIAICTLRLVGTWVFTITAVFVTTGCTDRVFGSTLLVVMAIFLAAAASEWVWNVSFNLEFFISDVDMAG
jgi:hypothetical protein